MTEPTAAGGGQKNLDNRRAKLLHRGLLLAIVLGSAVAMSPNPAGPDLWGHVRYGRDILATGQIPASTTYSFTADGYRWINHEILAELLLAIGADTIGATGLVIVKFLLSLMVILLVMRGAQRQGAHLLTVCSITLLVATNLAFHWSVRPQLLTYTCFTLLIVLLRWCFHGWQDQWRLPLWRIGSNELEEETLEYSSYRLRHLWLAPILFFFWANSHGGFVAGYAIFVAYLGCRSIEALCTFGRPGLAIAGRFALMIVVTGLATLVNAYGPSLHAWLIQSLTLPRPEITEWRPPELFEIGAIELWLMIGLFASSLVLSRRRLDFTHLVIMTLTLWQSLDHQRHLPFFALLFGFWMPMHVESMLQRIGVVRANVPFTFDLNPKMARIMTVGLTITLGLLLGRLSVRLSDLRVEKSRFPVSAMQFIADHDINGRMVVTYNWAQYVIGVFGNGLEEQRDEAGGVLVAFDGRFRTCYPQQIIDMNFDFVLGDGDASWRWRDPTSPPFDGARVLDFRNPDLVLISRGQPHSQKVMEQHEDQWVLLYQDEVAQLWGRRTTFDNANSPQYISPANRRIGDEAQEGSVTWPALPDRNRKSRRLAAR